ncbi:MAG: glycosyltransferase family 2 protein [Acidobacteria bacterium]|nr:glycosyltransferase family 2 protein [Acidobacteriota bacterium]
MGASPNAPRIAAIVGVKDEVELVGASIKHLRQIGVDHIIVADAGSTDGTLDVLEDERRGGDVVVTHVDPTTVVDYDTESAHAMALARASGADWVLFMDADEFFIPATGSLKDCRHLQDADVIVADRFNVVVTPDHLLMPTTLTPRHYGRLSLFTRQVGDFRRYMDDRPHASFVTVRPGPKVLARPSVAAALAPGGHDVHATGARRAVATDLIVAHVPFTTQDRFERKVANIRKEVEMRPAYFAGGYAWHWRRWAEMTAPGALDAEFARQITYEHALAGLRREGVVRSAAELLAERAPVPVAAPTASLAGRLWHELQAMREWARHPLHSRLRPVH